MLWTTTSDVFTGITETFNRHKSTFFVFLLIYKLFFRQLNSHSVESSNPRICWGFLLEEYLRSGCWVSIRLLVWLILITNLPSHDWFFPWALETHSGLKQLRWLNVCSSVAGAVWRGTTLSCLHFWIWTPPTGSFSLSADRWSIRWFLHFVNERSVLYISAFDDSGSLNICVTWPALKD